MKRFILCILSSFAFITTIKSCPFDEETGNAPLTQDSKSYTIDLKDERYKLYRDCGKVGCMLIAWAGIGFTAYITSKFYHQ